MRFTHEIVFPHGYRFLRCSLSSTHFEAKIPFGSAACLSKNFILNLQVISYSDGEHGEVVTLLGIAYEVVYGLYHAVDHGFRGELAVLNGTVQFVEDPVFAKEFFITIIHKTIEHVFLTTEQAA